MSDNTATPLAPNAAPEWLPEIRGYIDEARPEILRASHHIHANPQVRFAEHDAAQLLSETLANHGFDVDTGVAGLPTAFAASTANTDDPEAPTIAVFCEYDALEGLGHGCGHNLIAAAGLGAALATRRWLQQHPEHPGRLCVLGSPAEEGGAGKTYLIEAGSLTGVDAALMIHPLGHDLVRMPSLARVALEVTFTGRAAHAAAVAHEGINALDAVTLTQNAIGLLRQQLRSDSRIHGIVTDGGQAPNIIPERASLRLFVRSPDTPYLTEHLVPAVRNCARGAALATGAEVEITNPAPAYASMRTNEVLAGLVESNLALLGRHPVDGSHAGGMGSTDMGNVSQIVPSAHPCLRLTPELTMHTHEAAAAAGSPAGDQVAIDGATVLALTTTQLCARPEYLTAARAEFADTSGA